MNNHLKLPESFLNKLIDTATLKTEQIKGLLLYKRKVDNKNRKCS